MSFQGWRFLNGKESRAFKSDDFFLIAQFDFRFV